MDREILSKQIQKLQFYAVELNLYLDNFPGNKKALEDYRKVSAQLNKLVEIYETKYGPLTNFGSASEQNSIKWTSQPWPWENC